MSGLHLQVQFSKIYTRFKGKDTPTTLLEMADVLCCTRRNARIVLNKMAQLGWLGWEPAVGRGKRSYLSFHQRECDLQMKRVRNAIKAGKLSNALEELNNDPHTLTTLIENQLGFSIHKDKHILRLPYYRSFPCLNPAKPLPPTEQFLASHIFNGLTKINHKTKAIEASLAHHWEAMTATHWRFYLRPCVKFHDGTSLKAEDVIWTFLALKNTAYFSHISHVQTPAINVVDFHLSRPDVHFARTLCAPMALIQSRENAKKTDRLPIGTGSFYVDKNDDNALVLIAHEHYFGHRALIDTVDIWVFDSASRACLNEHAFDPHLLDTQRLKIHRSQKGEISEFNEEDEALRLEKGAYCLLLNRQNGLATDPNWAQYLSSQLSGPALLPSLTKMEMSGLNTGVLGIGEYHLIPAYGLLPGWMHTSPIHTSPIHTSPIHTSHMQTTPMQQANSIKTAPPFIPSEQTTLRLVHQANHPLFPLIAKAIKAQLKNDGIELEVAVLPFEEMMQGREAHKTDLWLIKMDCDHDSSDGILAWIMCLDVFSKAILKMQWDSIKEKMNVLREMKTQKTDLNALSVGRTLVQTHQIIPLFHSWVGANEGEDTSSENLRFQNFLSQKTAGRNFKTLWQKHE